MPDSPALETVLLCPQCAQANPREAVMCWACYASLIDTGANGSGPLRVNSPAQTPLQQKWDGAVPFLVIGALTSSGWLPRRWKFPMLLMGLAPIAFVLARQKQDERKAARQAPGDVEPPEARIAKTILYYARRDGASKIRLRHHKRGVEVHYFVDEEWRDQMRIPGYAWRSLRDEFCFHAFCGRVVIRTEHLDIRATENVREEFRFTLHLDIEPELETLIVSFAAALVDENERAQNGA